MFFLFDCSASMLEQKCKVKVRQGNMYRAQSRKRVQIASPSGKCRGCAQLCLWLEEKKKSTSLCRKNEA